MAETFSEGDLIEATKGDTVLRGRVRDIGQGPFIEAPDLWTLALENEGFTLKTIEKAESALPTEPGWYTDKSGQLWSLRINGHGEPEWFLSGVYYGPKSVASAAPFTRLAPVADTAKQVLETVLEYWAFGAPPGVNAAIVATGEHFGVSS